MGYFMNKKIFLKRISIITFILVFLIYTIAIITKPAQGYERSLYAMYPSFFWIGIFATIILSIIIIILSEYWKIQDFWIVGLTSTLIIYSIILLLPLIRGYYMINWGDSPAHLSWAQHILNTGEINTYYPISHIQLVTLNFSGITLETVAILIPAIFTVLYILGLTILGRTLQRGPWISLLPILFAIPLIPSTGATGISPQVFAFCLLPLFYYIIFSTYDNFINIKQKLIILIILSFFLVFLHPFAILVLLTLLLGFYATTITIKCKNKYNNFKNIILQCLLLLSVTFTFWYISYQSTLLDSITKVINTVFVPDVGYSTIFDKQMEIIEKSDVSIFRFIEVFIKNYGSQSIYLLIGLFCILLVIYNIWMKRTSKMEILFLIQYFITIVFSYILISGYLIITSFGRAFSQMLVMTTIFVPIVLYKQILMISSQKLKKYIYLSIAFLIIIVSTLSITTIFPSPWNYSQNSQFSYHDKSGYDWFLVNKDETPTILITESYWDHWKYEMYFLEQSLGSNKYINRHRENLPLKTVYYKYSFLTDALPTGQYYLLSNEYSLPQKFISSKDQKELSLDPTLIIRLKQDNSINLLFNNGEFESWWIPVSISV